MGFSENCFKRSSFTISQISSIDFPSAALSFSGLVFNKEYFETNKLISSASSLEFSSSLDSPDSDVSSIEVSSFISSLHSCDELSLDSSIVSLSSLTFFRLISFSSLQLLQNNFTESFSKTSSE